MIPGFVLAGGRSKRMGTDKALLEIDGTPMAARIARVMEKAGCTPVTLVGRQAALATLGWPVLQDHAPDHHPLYGVATALDTLPDGLALIAPCDLPGLRAENLQSLLALGSPCVAIGPTGVHPLVAVLPASFAARARALAGSGGAAHELTEGLARIPVPPEALHDANRPVDLPQPAE